MEKKYLKIALSVVLLCSQQFVLSVIMNMGSVPAGSQVLAQASQYGMTTCRMVCLPSSAGAITVLRMILLGGNDPSSYQAISNAGQLNINAGAANFNVMPHLAQGIYFIAQPPTFPVGSNQLLNYHIYDNTGTQLYTNTYTFNVTSPDYAPGQSITGVGRYAYHVSPTYQFSAPSGSMFFIQSPLVNLNGSSECAPIAAAAVPAMTTAMGSGLATLGISSSNIVGVPLSKAAMTIDVSLAIPQSASTYPCYFTLKNISKILTAAQLIKGVYVVLQQPLIYNSPTYNANSNNLTYVLYDNTGAVITSAALPCSVEYGMPTQWCDNLNYIITASTHPVVNQMLPAQAVPLGLYVIGDCVNNPMLVTTAAGAAVTAPYPQAFFLQYSATGQVSPAGAPAPKKKAHKPAVHPTALIATINSDVNDPSVGVAAVIQNYETVAISNPGNPVSTSASAAITSSWNVIYDLYALIESLSPSVAHQLPTSLQRPAA